MALSGTQLDLIKLYMASFNRPPEKGGFDYWTGQIAGGKTFAQVVNTVFSLEIVKEIYPDNLPDDAFLTLIYINIFNKIPDAEGLAYWLSQLGGGTPRSTLVMDMINAGLGTPDGTEGKAFIVNRYAVAQHAVEQQIAKNTEISITTLKKILAGVTEESTTVAVANTAIDADNAGGLGAPKLALSVPAAVNAINPTEKTAGVAVVVDLSGTNAVAGNTVEILINGGAFTTPVTRVLIAADVTAQKATVTIASLAGWGTDGSKVLSARIKDAAGHVSSIGGDTTVILDTTPPNAPTKPLTVDAATDGINSTEKLNGVAVIVNLTGTNAGAGDTVTLLIGGLGFATPVTRVLTLDDINAKSATLTIGNTAGWGIDGTKVLTARVTDVAGNVGTAGGNLSVVLDTASTTISSVLAIAAAANGIGAAMKAAGMDVVVNLSGTTAIAGDTVDVLIGGVAFSTPVTHVLTTAEVSAKAITLKIAAADSAWGSDGSKILTARVKDAAGNVGTAGGSLTVKLDTVGPTAPTNALVVPTGDISGAEKIAGVAVTIDLTGTGAAAGDTVSLLVDGAAFATPLTRVLTTADVTTLKVILTIPGTASWGADGNKILTARLTDAAGNGGAAGGSVTVLLKTVAPGAPTSPIAIAAAANGISATEKTSGVDVVVALAGTSAIAGDSVGILIGGLAFATPVTRVLTAADIAAGTATVTIASAAGWGADGSKILSARVTDVAGNVGIAGGALTVGLDTTAPGIPTLVTLTPVGGTVVTNSVNGTNTHLTAKANIAAGQATGGSAVLKIGGVVIASDASILAADTSVNFTTSDGSPTNAELQAAISAGGIATVTLTDAAGNSSTSAANGPLLTVNYTGPGIPNNSVTVAAGDISATEKTTGVAVVVNLAGTGAAIGDKVALMLDGAAFTIPVSRVLVASDITAQSTTLTIGATAGWGTDGSKTLTAVVIDAAGNTGVPNTGLTLTLDTVAPSSPSNVIAIAAATNGISNAEKVAGVGVIVDLTGTNAVAGDSVSILIGGIAFATPVNYVLTGSDITAGNAMLTIASTAGWGTDGSKILSARFTDYAGNIGVAGGNVTVILDTVAPSAPTNAVAIAAAANGINSSEIAAGVAVVVNLNGTNAVAGNTLEITIGGAAFSTPMTKTLSSAEITAKSATVTIAATAGWGVDGAKTLGAHVIDTAGNVGNVGGSLGITVDTTPATSLGVPQFVNNAGSAATYDPTDVIKLFLNEGIAPASIGTMIAGGSGTANLDTSSIAAFGAAGGYATQFNVTLSGGALSLLSGDTITLVGIDAAGNQANVTWTLV